MTIHLIAPKDKNKWDFIWKKCYFSLQNLPYKIKIWDDKAVDKELFNDDKNFYNNFLNHLHPIYKWDYIRYLILEKYGGIYLDMDVEVVSNFFELLDPNTIYIAEGHWNCPVSNHMMISSKTKMNSLVWNSVKEKMKSNIVENFSKCKESYLNTLYTVGPIALSNFMFNWKFKYEKLSYIHFSLPDSTLSFAKHYQTNVWAKQQT